MELSGKYELLKATTEPAERRALIDQFFVECAIAKAAEINDAPVQRTEFGAWGRTRVVNGYNESNEHEQTSNSHRPSCQQ